MRIVLVLAGFLFLAAAAFSATIHVPADFQTIQEAVDASQHGDLILLADGVYRGTGNRNIDFKGKAIVLRSESGNPESCVVDPEGVYPQSGRRGFDFKMNEGAESVVCDITIMHGVTDDC